MESEIEVTSLNQENSLSDKRRESADKYSNREKHKKSAFTSPQINTSENFLESYGHSLQSKVKSFNSRLSEGVQNSFKIRVKSLKEEDDSPENPSEVFDIFKEEEEKYEINDRNQEMKSEENEQIKLKITELDNKLDFQQLKLPREIHSNRKKEHVNLIKENKKEAKKASTIDITFWEYIRSYIKSSNTHNEKLALIKKGVKEMEERLDIFNIMRKFREIDKLKALLFEDDQLKLFNCMPKAELSVVGSLEAEMENVSHRILKNSKFLEINEEHELIRSLKKISAKPKKSKIDQRLLAIFEETIKY